MTVPVSVERIFEYIRDFPDSLTELRALRDFLQQTRLYKELCATLQKQLKTRLLIPGAHTKDILKMYVRTHKTLQYLLQSEMRLWGLVSETSDLVVGYLLRRKDAVKCVVAAMLGDDDVLEESEAMDEVLLHADGADERNGTDCMSEISEDALEWQPGPFRVRRGENEEWQSEEFEDERRRSVVQLLVAVFGGREKFLAEFRAMLASRLLQIGSSYECEREVASLEMMKLKFGEDDLIDCQVMLKDIASSRRINQAIHQVISHDLSNLSALIISRHYWPDTTAGTAAGTAAGGSASFLPPSLERLLEEYARNFHVLRPSQQLHWRRDAGVVDITVELGPAGCGLGSADFRVSPVQVAVLSLFEREWTDVASPASHTDEACLSVEEAGRLLQISSETAKRELAFWVSQNVLVEVDVNTFALAHKQL